MPTEPQWKQPPRTIGGLLVLLWGVGGLLALLVSALYRLTPWFLEAVQLGITPTQWAICLAWTLLNAYAEGYRGFQRGYCPRVVLRGLYLAHHGRPLWILLAPLFCMGLFHATRKRLIVAWCLVLGITGLVILVRLTPQPWRGIIDLGVLVGLGWGVVATLWYLIRALAGQPPEGDGALPGR